VTVSVTFVRRRYGIKGSGRSGAALLPTLLEVLPQHFTSTRHSAFL
jgi:hypothetical protein